MARCLVFGLLLLAPARAGEDPALSGARVWKGFIEVAAVSSEPPDGRGREIQKERIDFVLLTEPPKQSVAWPRLPMLMREGFGSYELSIDFKTGQDAEAIVKQGEGQGKLYPRVQGFVEPTQNRYKIVAAVTPGELVARSSIAGMWEGKPTAWRTVLQRTPFLGAFEAEGELDEQGRVLRGTRSFLDRRQTLDRQVDITWRIERIDPVVKGRIVDQHERAVPGMKVFARHTNPERRRNRLPPLWREGESDVEGRFRLECFWAPWTVEVVGLEREGIVYEGRVVPGDVQLRLDDVPDLVIQVKAYDLARLPRPELLRRHFQGDVGRYLAWLRERVSEEVLARALISR